MYRMLAVLLLGGLFALASSTTVYAQGHTVTGTVTDLEDGSPLPSATVVVRGTQIGTATDANGRFTLEVPTPNEVLVFSFVGYTPQEIPIGGRATINVQLAPMVALGDEVVVVGYGAVARRDVTGAVTSISSRDIQELPVLDAGSALQGRAAGVVALQAGTGRPGEGVEIRIRGRRSINASNDPLYVVDGIPLEGGLSDINPNDILSMEVLKDASATAIYGSRGANGVVLITTNRGGAGRTQVSYSAHVGSQHVRRVPGMMTGEQFAQLRRDAYFGSRGVVLPDEEIFTAQELAAIQAGATTDWQGLIVQPGYQTDHQLSVQGGDQRTRFYLSGNYTDEQGVVPTMGFTRGTFRLNLDHNISDRFRVGTSTQVSNQVQDYGSNPLGTAVATNPLAGPYDEQGNLLPNPGGDPLIWNPLLDVQPEHYIDERSRVRVFSNIFAEYDILPNLSYRLNFGPDLQSWQRGLFQMNETVARQLGTDFAQKEHDRQLTYTVENIVNHTQRVGEHNFNTTGLFSFQEHRSEWSMLQGEDLPYSTQLFHNIGTAENTDASSFLSQWGLMSFMGRVNYSFRDRYLITLTGRADGSSRLSEQNRWGFFPSVALAWHLGDEPFLANQQLFSEIKLRASYGSVGNTAIAPFQTRGGMLRTRYNFGDEAAFGYRPTGIPNPYLTWETSNSMNFGLDFGMWQGRVSGAVELYRTRTYDLLLARQIPVTSGYNQVLQNVGSTQNMGYEVMISTLNLETRNFSWSTDFNVFGNREEILSLFGLGDDVGNQWFIGRPLNVWYDFERVGIWQLDEAEEAARYGQVPGQIRVRDVNGDGVINQEDQVILGTDLPRVSGGITNRFRYGNVDASIFLFGAFGHMVYDQFLVDNSTLVGRFNNLAVDYWTPQNPANLHPQPERDRDNPVWGGTRGYTPGDFVKVRNVTLGYRFPTSLMQTVGAQIMRVYVSADSPLVWSHMQGGVDPERAGGQIGAGTVPATRLFRAGVNLTF